MFCRCDRILSYGKGIRLLNYKRSELKLSDHRPVTATFTVDVEIFCQKKLQRALTFTDAEIEENIMSKIATKDDLIRVRPGEVSLLPAQNNFRRCRIVYT